MKKIIILSVLVAWVATADAIDVKRKGENVNQKENTADSLLGAADDIFQKRDYKEALTKYSGVYDQAREEFNRSVEVEALAQMARMNLLLGEKETGRNWLVKAGERGTDSDPLGWSRYLGVKGRFEWQDKDLKSARKTFLQMYEYSTSNALWGRAVDAAHMVAIVAEDPNEQIEWGHKGIKTAEANDNERWLGPLWNNLAGTYYDMKQLDSALSCYEKAREYHWRFSGEVGKLFADYHVGMTHRLLGHYEEAGSWLRPVLAWAEQLGNHSAIGQACEDLGEIEIAQERKAAGLEMFKRARDEYKKAGFDQSWPEIWGNINKRIAEIEG